MFSSKYVKITKTDFELLKIEMDEMRATIKALKTENTKLQQTELLDIIKRQSDEIKKLSKYQEQDEVLYSYEQSNDAKNQKINELERENTELKYSCNKWEQAYKKSENMNSLLMERMTKRTDYETVTLLDVRG